MTFSLNNIVATVGLFAISATAVTSAVADSNVSVYGRIDTAIASVKTGDQRVNQMDNGGSYIGFRGVEDLGNGLKAGFVLESNFASDTGANLDPHSFFDSRSEVFLEGNFGTVRMGRFLNPSYYAIADRASLHNEDYGVTYDQLYVYQGLDTNRLAYASPEMYGLKLEAAMSFHERANGDHTDKNAYDFAANYDRGDWSFGVGYGEHGKDKQYALRAAWSRDAWTIAGYHQRAQEVDDFTAVKTKINVSRASVSYAVGAGEVHANYGYANAQGPAKADQWTVGYNHHLSKRTKLYAFYSQLNNKHGAQFGDDLNANEDRKSLSLGITHKF